MRPRPIVRIHFVAVVALFAAAGGGRAEAQLKDVFKDQKKKAEGAKKFLAAFTGFVNGKRDTARYEHLLATAQGQSASNLSKLSKSVKVFKTLGTVGAALGAGLAIADAFHLFGPSAEEQTKQALAEISGKIDKLESTMLDKFDKMEIKLDRLQATTTRKIDDAEYRILNQVKLSEARLGVRAHITRLSTLQKQVELYTRYLRERNPDYAKLDLAEKTLAAGIKPSEIFEAVNGVYEGVMGENLATDLLEAEYRSSHGDPSRLTEVSMILTRLVQSGQASYGLVQVLQMRRGDEHDFVAALPNPEDRVKYSGRLTYEGVNAVAAHARDQFGPLFEKIGDRMDAILKKAVEERSKNAAKYIEDRFGGTAHLDRRPMPGGNEGSDFNQPFKPMLDRPEANYGHEIGKEYWNGNHFWNKWGPESKDGSLAMELKRRYLCDWLVLVYHPINVCNGKDQKLTGVFSYENWFWKGSNCIWFYEEDPDFPGSNGVFLLLKWSDSTERFPAPPRGREFFERNTVADWPGKKAQTEPVMWKWKLARTHSPALTSDEMNDRKASDIAREVAVLQSKLGTDLIENAGARYEESGLVMEFRIHKPAPQIRGGKGGFLAEFRAPELAKTATYTQHNTAWQEMPFPQGPGAVRKCFDVFYDRTPATPAGRQFTPRYGALYLETTWPDRMHIDGGLGKLVITYR